MESIKKEYEELNKKLSEPDLLNDNRAYRESVKKHSGLIPLVETYNKYLRAKKTAKESEEILQKEEDPELREMASSETEEAKAEMKKLSDEIKKMLIPSDPDDVKNAIVEIRAGTGGDEAGLFAGDLFKMYSKYAENSGFSTEILSSSVTSLGGFKEVVFNVAGKGAYGRLKFESGIHRVQRVPETETGGRIHTSAVTVAVLPEQEAVDFEIDKEDLKIDVFRASGAGGQHVNKVESAVRIIHVPTGTEASCQDDRSQSKNREKAMKILRARVKEKADREEKEKLDKTRKSYVGTGDRSGKIRTYNFPQNRMTDHRAGLTLHNLEELMEGEIGPIVEKLAEEEKKKMMEG